MPFMARILWKGIFMVQSEYPGCFTPSNNSRYSINTIIPRYKLCERVYEVSKICLNFKKSPKIRTNERDIGVLNILLFFNR